jgi:hypothetical protein
MIDVDDRWVDVDFPREPEYTYGYSGPGNISKFASFEDTEKILTDAEVRAAIEKMDAEDTGAEWLVTRIFAQLNEGSCVYNACSQANEVTQCRQYGPDEVVHLSAISGYKQIGSSPSSGANIGDGLDCLEEIGTLPLDNEENKARFKHTMPNTGFRLPYPDGWKETAKLFRVQGRKIIRSVLGLLTALVKRQPVVVGRAGHSICYLRPRWSNANGYTIDYPNSWGKWGFGLGRFDYGYGRDTMRLISSSASYCFTFESIVPDFTIKHPRKVV